MRASQRTLLLILYDQYVASLLGPGACPPTPHSPLSGRMSVMKITLRESGALDWFESIAMNRASCPLFCNINFE